MHTAAQAVLEGGREEMPHRACVLGLDEQSDWSSAAQDLRAYLQVSQIRLQAPFACLLIVDVPCRDVSCREC